MNRRRGPSAMQRYEFLSLLRAGTPVEEAAQRAGVTVGALAQLASRDGELRAALDGMPVHVQVAAQRAEWLAALVRCGGNMSLAEAQAGLSPGTQGTWQKEPEFAAVVAAVRTWVTGATQVPRKPKVPLSDEKLARLRELWETSATADEIAAELGISRNTLQRSRRLAGLPPRQPAGRVYELADQFRELWTSGAPYSEMQEKLGITDPTVSEWRKKLGLPSRITRPSTPPE